MAYYAYKTVLHLIPKEFKTKFEANWKEETGEDFDCTSDYDGSLWLMAAAYIEHLHNEIEESKF